jgi:hypothetical protein
VPVRLWQRTGSVGNEGARTEVASTVSNTEGQWVLIAPPGPSRALSVSCGGQAQAATVNAINTVVEIVRPTLSLRVGDRSRGRLTFAGRLRIAPLGHPTPLVEIQASSNRRKWSTIGDPVRTGAQGHFAVHYHSPRSVGGRFYFRAVTPATALWQEGRSRVQPVKVR